MNELQPLNTLRVIGDLPLSARHKAVLWALLIFADKEGKCWPSHATLAAKAGLSRSTVKVTLGELVALEHVTKTNRRLAGRSRRIRICIRICTSFTSRPSGPATGPPWAGPRPRGEAPRDPR